MLKAFGLIPLVVSFFICPVYSLGFYSLKPKSFYMKVLEKGLLPFDNGTNGIIEEVPKNLPVLVGVLIVGKTKKAILFFPKEKLKKEVIEGEKLGGEFVVKLIRKYSVVLSKGQKEYEIKMYSEEAKKTRDKRKQIAYIPSSRKNVQGITSTVIHGSSRVKASEKSKGPIRIEFPNERRKKVESTRARKAKSFIDIIKNLTKGKSKTSHPVSNPFLNLFKK